MLKKTEYIIKFVNYLNGKNERAEKWNVNECKIWKSKEDKWKKKKKMVKLRGH